MSNKINESVFENTILDLLQEMGYEYLDGPTLSKGGSREERNDYRECILEGRLRDALTSINSSLPADAIDEAVRKVRSFNTNDLVENNKYFHGLLTEGIDVQFVRNGEYKTEKAMLIDFDNPDNNNFLAVNQFTIIENENRRPDIIIFINGLPLVVFELKSPDAENATISDAYNQIQTYKRDIPTLFYYNAFSIITDGYNSKVGTLTANEERFMNWRTIDGENIAPLSEPQYEIMIRGMLEKERLVDILQNFILYQDVSTNNSKATAKILAAYHQYFAVKKALATTKHAISSEGDKRAGVIWHTQGSGKSFTMVFYTAMIARKLNNPTIIVLTDRNDLDDQLYKTFANSSILRETPKHADVRKLTDKNKTSKSNSKEVNGLYDLLNNRQSGGIIFTTIQKFAPDEDLAMPVLTDRSNVIIMADEAHRSQYGLEAKNNAKTGEVKFGYAKYLRDALPNASFIGFTGTPIETDNKSTLSVFGNYIDVYDMTRAVEDKATVQIFYENRVIKLSTDDDILEELDEEFDELSELDESGDKEKRKSKWSKLEAVVGSPNRIEKLANDIVNHYETRNEVIDGKAMIVVMSRRIAVDLYDAIVKIRPDWHSDDVNKGKIKVVMTGSASDEERLQIHAGGKQRRDILAKRIKDNNDELKIVIVRDMWLTGFDVPSMHTMYIDKLMKGHNLMQAIARVNRVFKDKPGGLVVDYIGILGELKKALKQYTPNDRKQTGINTDVAVSKMQECLDILRSIMHNIDYSEYMGNNNAERMRAVARGMDHVLSLEENDQKDFKKQAVLLAKSHSLCSATPEGIAVALEVSYFKAVKASIQKLTDTHTAEKKKAIDDNINNLLKKSIITEEVIDVFDTLGLSNEVSILSEEFLEEVRHMEYKNLAVEMLRKILDDNVKSIEKRNVAKSEKFSEMLKKTINKYHNQALTNAQVVAELIKMAQEMKKDRENGNNLGLNEDEIAFYDALSDNERVKELMQDDTLKRIAIELTSTIRNSISIDWNLKSSAQAGMRRTIKRLLKKYDYPPDEVNEAMDLVIRQAERMCSNIDPEDIVNHQNEKVAEDIVAYK